MIDFPNIKNILCICLFMVGLNVMALHMPGDTLPVLQPITYKMPAAMMFDCDVCGCSGNGGSMGYGTASNSNFIGVRYIYQQYRSRDGIFNNSPWIDENFNTLQLWSRIPLGKKFLVSVLVPYHFHNRQFADGSTQQITGLGDATLMGFYSLVTPNKDSVAVNPKKWMHTVKIGGGVKAPTGSYNSANNEGSVNPSFQVGTGSWDYVLAADYAISKNKWGANVMANYVVKTENKELYHFGNQFNYGVDFYKMFTIKDKFMLTPSLGAAGENYAKNEQYSLTVVNTGGNVFFSKIGVEAVYTNWAVGVNTMLPIKQHLNNGKVEVKSRLGLYLNYNL